MLDVGNSGKQSKRTHLCVRVELDKNAFYIPLQNNLGADVRKFGRIGHSVPSEKRKNAGYNIDDQEERKGRGVEPRPFHMEGRIKKYRYRQTM